ncbi:MAG: D-alanine--D-alanine ligase [Thermoanaerobaculum sp.]|nr:D-alanine--D-alanine ligase [Thermoanaerobaculum sp.]
MARLKVGLVFGGRSGEHEVSVVSARSVARALDSERYQVIPMAIDRRGRWADATTAEVVLGSSGDRTDGVVAFEGILPIDPRLLQGDVDVVVPILHGPFGEDGTIQGLCEMLDLPYVGCNVEASAITMNKVTTKRLLREAGLPVVPFVVVEREEGPAPAENRIRSLGLPLFVKPARLGSSVGVSKVKSWDALASALALAFRFDDLVVVEAAVDAREIEVAVLGGTTPVVSVPGEVVPGHEFYDYADKYLDNACQLLAPAPLAREQEELVRRLAWQAFQACACDAMARVDFLLDRHTGNFFVNELNSIPGFTPISMYPRLLALSGVSYAELLDRLISLALNRHRRRQELAAAALQPLSERLGSGG